MPNGIDLEEMFRAGARWSARTEGLALIGFFVSIFVTGVSTAFSSVLWGLWISIFWLNMTVFFIAYGASRQLNAINLALRGVRDESDFSRDLTTRLAKPKQDKPNSD